ncbi:MAG: PQQ-binding-like beta-propeller repeat protein [Candidatus Bathyarchaeia archaeon]|jgi:hypothetical protein
MKILTKKTAVILLATILMISMTTSLLPKTLGQLTNPAGTVQTSYPYVRVGPNPIGVGQTATIIMFVAQPTLTSEPVTGWTVVVTDPNGVKTTLGPFVSDATGGTDTLFTPSIVGNYTFQGFVARQVLSDGTIWAAGTSNVDTLVVQSAPVSLSNYPITPLPTSWWQTPVTAENVQNWYAISGPWLGYGINAFAITGGYNNTQNQYNPYTLPVMSGHILWTKPWATGGVVGGNAGGNEVSSHFWSTDQYWPKYAPVVMNGIMYSTQFDTDTSNNHGTIATDLYTGKTLWTLNSTSGNLVCGMETFYKNANQYGTVGPYIVTMGVLPGLTSPSGTAYNLWDAMNGQYADSIINAPAMGSFGPFGGPEWGADDNGNLIAYYVDSTNASQPMLQLFNMTVALGEAFNFGWNPPQGGIFNWTAGLEWSKPIFTSVNGGALKTGLAVNGVTDNTVILTGEYTFGQFYGGLQQGYNIVAGMDATTGAQLWIKNFTSADTPSLAPWTRTQMQIFDGLWVQVNQDNDAIIAVNARDGSIAWQSTLPAGINSNGYDVFNLRTYNGLGCLVCVGFGGDIWCVNETNGKTIWQTNTISLLGNPGLETPYATWPLWTFICDCITNNVGYFAVGHEYNPPLFHGAQLIALNMTNGQFIWSVLDMSIESTEISYGIMLSRNAYDNQIYAFGKGPSTMTVTAPNIGVTTATPITITGTVMDISAGASQDAVAKNFPNGIPCVSDASQSHWMEYVYEQQPIPANTTGVPITLSVIDANNNFRTIGTTTSDASGTYSFTWTPDIPGAYAVIASFGGSNSYYGSTAETHFYASSPAATATPAATPATGLVNNTTLEYGIIAIIIVIIIIGAVLALLIMRKHP